MSERVKVTDLGRTLRRDPWALGFLAVLLLLELPYYVPLLNADQQWYYGNYYWALIQQPAVMLAILGGLGALASRRERRFWGFLTVAYGFSWIVVGYWVFVPEVLWGDTSVVATDCIYMLFYLGIFLAIETRPHLEADGESAEVRRLQASGIVILVITLLIYFVVIPVGLHPEVYDTWVPSLYFYVVLDLILALRFGRLAQLCRAPRWRLLYGLLGATAILWAITDTLETLTLQEVLPWEPGARTDLLWDVPVVTLVLAARLRHHRFPAEDRPRDEEPAAAAGGVRFESPLVLSVFLLPVVHLTLNSFGMLDTLSHAAREVVVLAGLLILGAMALIEHGLLHRRSSRLEREGEEKAKQIEERTRYLNALLESSPLAILVLDRHHRVQICNPAFESLFLYDQAEILGQPLDPLITTDEEAEEAAQLTGMALRGESVHVITRRRRKDKTSVDVEIHGVPLVIDGTLAAIFAIYKDVTREVSLEAQLHQAQKMEALGQLAGGVAHDFNNLLIGIRWHTEFALKAMAADDPLRRDLIEVERALDSATALTRQLLALGRRQRLKPIDLVLNDIVGDLLNMLHRTMGEQVEIDFLPAADLGTARVDPGQLEQVILNLCLNARDAVPVGGGRIALGTRNAALDDAFCAMNPWARPGRFVVLTVSDNGQGMDAAIQSRIFEPFFTTKANGKGTGLGLATVYGIVQQHEGMIHVTSEPGGGTAFEVFFPRIL